MSPATQDFEHWRENVSMAFVPLDAVSTGPSQFEGTLVSSTLGALQLSEVAGREVDVRRTRATIRRSDPGLIKVGLQLSGCGTIVQNGREAVLHPGDFAVYDTSSPYELHFAGNFEMFVVMFPREELRIDPRELTTVAARRIEGGHGVGALVSPFLHTLRCNAFDGTLPAIPMLEHAVLDLMCAALDDAAPQHAPGSTLLLEAKSLAESHLDDPTLSTTTLAARLHISVRYLQKLFESDGRTVAGWIRSRRLDRCHRDLRNPRFAADSIGTICARNGLIDSSNFSKLFKETYGVSPREYRVG